MSARVVATPLGLGLVDDDAKDLSPLVIDLAHGRKLAPDDDLVKALGRDKGTVTVVDATAGIGRDATALRNAGFTVIAIERAPLVVELWNDALARHRPERLRFVAGDAIAWLLAVAGTADAPDAVFVDPMYPHADRKALAQKEMRLLRAAAGDDLDAGALVAAACAAARLRVVVKRPKKAPALTTSLPLAHSWAGASTRLDLYVVLPTPRP